MSVTAKQHRVLDRLQSGPTTSRHIADNIGPDEYDRVHSLLRTLEDHGLVRRSGTRAGVTLWELTAAGRETLETAE